jgi:hypothetical protein
MVYSPTDSKAKNKYVIASHRRSGSHFFLEVIKRNQGKVYNKYGTIRHWMPDHYLIPRDCEDLSKVFNVVRDGRDVLVSCYYYYQKVVPTFEGSFQDYLYGKIEIENPYRIMGQHWTKEMFYDPIGYWIKFVESWLGIGNLIKYEDLLEKYPDYRLVGKHKRKGIKGDYLNHFTNEDNEYFMSKAESLMKELKYE